MRRAAKVDDNHGEIVERFRQYPGIEVLDLSRVGGGCADILVQAFDRLWLVEIKDGSKPPSKRRLTPDQEKFHSKFRVFIVESIEAVDTLVRNWNKIRCTG